MVTTMTVTSRAAAVAVLAVAMSLPLAEAGAAPARSRHWTTVATVAHGKVQACKHATSTGSAWRIRLRVDGTDATKLLRGSAKVEKQGGQRVGRPWNSGRVKPGQISKVGGVRLPRGSGYEFMIQLEADSAGSSTATGLVGTARSLHHC